MKLMLRRMLIMAVVLLPVTDGSVSAQNSSPQPQVKRFFKLSEPVNKSYGKFNIDFEYNEEDAWAGNNNLEVRVTVTTIEKKNLKFLGFELDDSSRTVIQRAERLSENSSNDGLLKTEYRCIFAINEQVIPQTYNVRLRFEPPDKIGHPGNEEYADIIVPFGLNVGVRSGGLLKFFDGPEDKLGVVPCTTGDRKDFYLPLINRFPRYVVNIEKIEVTSSPGGLIRSIVSSDPPGQVSGNTISFDQEPMSIESAQRKPITISLEMAGMSFNRLTNGFFVDPQKLEIAFTYSDGHGRRISDLIRRVDLRVQPSFLVLSLSILLGAAIGTVIKLVVARTEKGKAITKSLVLITLVAGVVVSFIVWIGKVQVFVWDLRGSYDNPLIICFIGLAAAMIGPALLESAINRAPKPPSPPASVPMP